MTLELLEPYGAASEAQIAEAEQALGIRFPDDYRRFLATVGGSETDATVPNTAGAYLSKLYDVPDLLYWNVKTRDHGFIAYVPGDYVAIGGGSGGSPCLRASDGSIWWADFEKAGGIPDEEPTEEIMHRLADDFGGFLGLFE